MTPEQIVRALAAADLTHLLWDDSFCAACHAMINDGGVAAHEPDCPWRLAVEWVEAVG